MFLSLSAIFGILFLCFIFVLSFYFLILDMNLANISYVSSSCDLERKTIFSRCIGRTINKVVEIMAFSKGPVGILEPACELIW